MLSGESAPHELFGMPSLRHTIGSPDNSMFVQYSAFQSSVSGHANGVVDNTGGGVVAAYINSTRAFLVLS